uniref:Uncharacterized protein n=1 Tax=Arundo donax TaxID=35708 RepID=A0A0A9FHB8_ARUDO
MPWRSMPTSTLSSPPLCGRSWRKRTRSSSRRTTSTARSGTSRRRRCSGSRRCSWRRLPPRAPTTRAR